MKSRFIKPVLIEQSGFSLVELILVIVIIGAIAMGASLLIGQAAQNYQKEDNYSAITNEDRIALEEMAREIRLLRRPGDITSSCAANTTALVFTDTGGNIMNYSFSGSVLTANGTTLAGNVSAFTLTFYDNNGNVTTTCSSVWNIGIALTGAQGNDLITMRTQIHPRSF